MLFSSYHTASLLGSGPSLLEWGPGVEAGGSVVWGRCCLLLYDHNNTSKSPIVKGTAVTSLSRSHLPPPLIEISTFCLIPSHSGHLALLGFQQRQLISPLDLPPSWRHKLRLCQTMSMHSLCFPFLFFPLSFSLPSPLPSTSLLFPFPIPSLSPTLSLLHALRRKGQLIFLPSPLISCVLVHSHRLPYQDCLSAPWKPGLTGKRSHSFFHSPNAPKEALPSQAKIPPWDINH